MTQTTERPARPSRPPGGRRRGPFARVATYYRQVVAELRKVIWPSRKELVTYTAVAITFVTFMVALVAAFDVAFAHAVLAVFG